MASQFHSAASPEEALSSDGSLRSALLESLYCDMLVLADEVRGGPAPEAVVADPHLRIRIACESLRLSARLMRMTQLLLDHRAGRAAPVQITDMLTGPINDAPLPSDLAIQLHNAARLERRLADLLMPISAGPPPILDLHRRLSQSFR